jgi:tRNA threonylcarbamoyl adenosine modification protein (Sua5/YciO/YrdC/YwlC family)
MLPASNVITVATGATRLALASLAHKYAAQPLKRGQALGVPTDTIYGVAADARSAEGVEMLYAVKGRSKTKPIAVCLAEIEQIHSVAHVTIPDEVLHQLLPGPVTLIFNRKPALGDAINPGIRGVGVRVPDDDLVRAVAAACGGPLALTSANFSGDPSCLRVEEFAPLWPKLATVFDRGPITDGPLARAGSTVVDLSEPGSYVVVRPGSAEAETCRLLEAHGLRCRQPGKTTSRSRDSKSDAPAAKRAARARETAGEKPGARLADAPPSTQAAAKRAKEGEKEEDQA